MNLAVNTSRPHAFKEPQKGMAKIRYFKKFDSLHFEESLIVRANLLADVMVAY